MEIVKGAFAPPWNSQISPRKRRAVSFTLIASLSLAFLANTNSLFLQIQSAWLTIFVMVLLALLATMIVGEIAKLHYPLSQHPFKYRRWGVMPVRPFDAVRMFSPLTVLCILSGIAWIALAFHWVRADREMAISRLISNGRVTIAAARATADSLLASAYIQKHAQHPTPAELAKMTQLTSASAASSNAYVRAVVVKPAPIAFMNTAWPLCMAAILPTVWLMRWRWLWQWDLWCRENNMCIGCGYDLRASVDRCPECGEHIPVRRIAEPARLSFI